MANTVSFQTEPLDQIRPELEVLLPLHYEEIAVHKDRIPLDPDWASYKACADAGGLHITTCRIDGVLKGYIVGFVRPHFHYHSTLHCYTDVFWLHPDHRKGGLGVKLFREYEAALKQRGVVRAYIACKTFFDLRPLFEALGWEHIEYQYAKLI